MNTAEILRSAAARVRQGWCQGTLNTEHGKHCALGAIYVTTREKGEQFGDAWRAVCSALGVECVAIWNDTPGRTQEQVALGLERAADQWEESHPDQVAPTVEWTTRELVTA